MKNIIIVLAIIVLTSCQINEKDVDRLVSYSIKAHGFDQLDNNIVTFKFRDREYSVNRTGPDYIYTRAFEDSSGYVIDSLVNSSELTRYLNNEKVNLSDEWKAKYANSVNSVLYFFQVPYTLNDPAAIKQFVGSERIDNVDYVTLKVTFQQEDGGEDYEDEYRYWIHPDTYLIDYFAYNYLTDGGGVRFRKAINRREIQGFVFQDYINYSPPEKSTPLEELPSLSARGELNQISIIKNENILVNAR